MPIINQAVDVIDLQVGQIGYIGISNILISTERYAFISRNAGASWRFRDALIQKVDYENFVAILTDYHIHQIRAPHYGTQQILDAGYFPCKIIQADGQFIERFISSGGLHVLQNS